MYFGRGFQLEKLNMGGLKEHEEDIRISRRKIGGLRRQDIFNVICLKLEYFGYFLEIEKSASRFIVARIPSF